MAGATRQSRTMDMASQAEAALSKRDVFAAERLAIKALMNARQAQDFDAMAAIVPTLMEARLARLKQAMKSGRITIIDEPVGEQVTVREGCYLVQPPQVGADARRLRVAAFEQGVAAVVLCREPLTILKLQPIVAISPGSTVRTKVAPPKNPDKPDMAWFAAALESLGTAAIDDLDSALAPLRRLDALLEHIDTVPEHEGLHHTLQQACMDAKAAAVQEKAARASRKGATSKDAEESDADLDEAADAVDAVEPDDDE